MKTENPYRFVTYVPLCDRFAVTLPGRNRARVLGSYPTLSLAMQERDAALELQRGNQPLE